DAPAGQPGGGVHGADPGERRVPGGGSRGCRRRRGDGARARRKGVPVMAATTAIEAQTPVRPARFTHTLAAEWTKLFSLRSTYITLVLGVVLSVGMTALVSVATGSTFDEWNEADQAQFEPIMFS